MSDNRRSDNPYGQSPRNVSRKRTTAQPTRAAHVSQQRPARERTRTPLEPRSGAEGERRGSSQRTSSTRRGSGQHTAPSRGSGSGAGRSNYSRGGYSARQPRNWRPIIALVIAVIVVLALILLGVKACKGCSSDEPSGANGKAAAGAEPTPGGEERIVISLDGDADTLVALGEDYIESGCHAIDRQEGDITEAVEVAGEVDTSTVGDYQVTYTVRNSENMENQAVRTVHVIDDMDKDDDGISVMMYHYVYADDNPPENPDTNYIAASKLEAQLQWLSENDYYYPSYEELSAYIAGKHSLPKKSVVLTFDDGEFGFLDNGIPLFEKYQIPCTSFIICIDPDASERIINYASPYVSFQSHTYGLHTGGNSGQGHGGKIFDLSEDELYEDAVKAQEILGTTEAVAYPFGDVSDDAPAALKRAGVLCAFTTEYEQVHKGADPYRLPRMRVFGDGDITGFYYQVETGAE